MRSEWVDILPRHPQAVVMTGGLGGEGLGCRVADPRVEQAAVDQREKVIIEAAHTLVQRGIGVPGEVLSDAAEQLKDEGATVGCQRGVGAVEESAGQVGCEGDKRVEGLWNERQDRRRQRQMFYWTMCHY